METSILWFSFWLLLVIEGGFYFLFPRITRRGLLFGVYVGEEASRNEAARRITNSWYRGMALWLTASAAVPYFLMVLFRGIVGGMTGASLTPVGFVAGLSLLPIGFLVEYLRAYYRARSLAQPGTIPAAAAFITSENSPPLFLPYLAIGIGLAAGFYSMAYAWSHYSQLPNMVPTHFGLRGLPDSWRPRSFMTVMMPPLMCLIMGVGIGSMAYLTGQAKRAIRYRDQGVSHAAQQRFRRIMANFLAVISMLLTGMMAILSRSTIQVALKDAPALSPAMMIMTLLVVIVALGGSIYIALKYGQGGSRLERSVADQPLTDGLADNSQWVLGMFYVNRDDPSIFVERRFGFGYTINFGNPKAVAMLCGFVGLIIAVAVIARLAG